MFISAQDGAARERAREREIGRVGARVDLCGHDAGSDRLIV